MHKTGSKGLWRPMGGATRRGRPKQGGAWQDAEKILDRGSPCTGMHGRPESPQGVVGPARGGQVGKAG